MEILISLIFWIYEKPQVVVNPILYENTDPIPYYKNGHLYDPFRFVFPLQTTEYCVSTCYSKRHPAIDYACDSGTLVIASKFGKVIRAENYLGYGNFIAIEHLDGSITRYGHLSKILVKTGEFVGFLQKIGEVGSTGISTGPHLHFEIIKNGKFIDPEGIIK